MILAMRDASLIRGASAIAAWLWFAAVITIPGQAQQATATVAEEHLYAGEPFLVRVLADGFPDDAELRCEYRGSSQNGLTVTFRDQGSQVSQFMHSENGKVTNSRTVRIVFTFDVTQENPGKFELGPFEVASDGAKAETRPLDLDCESIELNRELFVDLEVESSVVFVGQHVPVRLTWGSTGDLNALGGYSLACPFFDMFRFQDAGPKQGDIPLRFMGNQGVTEISGTIRRAQRGGEKVMAVVSERIMIPDRAGTFAVPAARLSAHRVERELLSPFDSIFQRRRQRVDRADRPVRAESRPFELVVKPVPTQGRPTSFGGAVETRVEVNALANRTDARVGDPIQLTIELRGGAGLSTAGLPPLGREDALSPRDFQVSDEATAGEWDPSEGVKQFVITVRPMNVNVRAIPPLEYAWFNPKLEQFESAKTAEIPLRVTPAVVIDEITVQNHAQNTPFATPGTNGKPDSPPVEPPSDASAASSAPVTAGKSLDLSLVTDSRQLRDTSRFTSLVRGGTMLGGLGLIAAAMWGRFREATAPKRSRRRRLRDAEQEIRSLAKLPLTAARAHQAAQILHRVESDLEPSMREAAEPLLVRLEQIAFAPPGTPPPPGTDIPMSLLGLWAPSAEAPVVSPEWQSRGTTSHHANVGGK